MLPAALPVFGSVFSSSLHALLWIGYLMHLFMNPFRCRLARKYNFRSLGRDL
jgi:hypothetical protein